MTILIENFTKYYKILTKVVGEKTSMDMAQAQLLPLLEEQMKKTDHDHNIENGIYLQVALTDELFLENKTEGWKGSMIEHKLFKTQNAGERIQNDLQQIIQHPVDYSRDIIYLYFLTLALGFKGKFTSSVLQKYKAHLYKLLFLEEPKSHYLIPENFEFTETKLPVGFVPGIKLWMMILSGSLVLYIIFTSAYWFGIQKELRDVVAVLDKKTRMK